jgi:hypothetical protein
VIDSVTTLEWAAQLVAAARDDRGRSLDSVSKFEWAQLLAAATGVVIAGLVAFMPYARRPKLSIEEDKDRSNSRVESSALGGLPHVRLLVTNAKRRRAAQNVRVLVEGYTPIAAHAATLTTLGHPSLEWPSASDAAAGAVTVFGGGARPITLGYFVRVHRDPAGVLQYVSDTRHGQGRPTADAWYLKLTIGLDINDNRDKLPPVADGYRIRLQVGADDGAARTFDVHIDWDGGPDQTPDQVLASALGQLAVE